MSSRHFDAMHAEQYVLGGLDGMEAIALERHSVVCDPCAAILLQEARLERRLGKAAKALKELTHPRRYLVPVSWAIGISALLVASAGMALYVARHRTPPAPVARSR